MIVGGRNYRPLRGGRPKVNPRPRNILKPFNYKDTRWVGSYFGGPVQAEEPTPVETFYLQTAQGDNLQTAQGDNILWYIEPAPTDADAQAFFDAITTAGGSLTSTEETAINDLVLDLKSYSLWDKMIGLYPVVGSGATEHSFNLKDPTQYNLTFNGTWTHSSSGASPGNNGYAQTGIIPSVIDFQTSGSVHYSMYIQEDLASGRYDMGSYEPSAGDWGMLSSFIGNNRAYNGVGTGWLSIPNGGNTDAHWIMTNDGSTSYIYKDGSSLVTGSKSISSGTSFEIYISANNREGSPSDYGQRDWALASIGLGMDATEASNYTTAVLAFQTALSRQN